MIADVCVVRNEFRFPIIGYLTPQKTPSTRDRDYPSPVLQARMIRLCRPVYSVTGSGAVQRAPRTSKWELFVAPSMSPACLRGIFHFNNFASMYATHRAPWDVHWVHCDQWWASSPTVQYSAIIIMLHMATQSWSPHAHHPPPPTYWSLSKLPPIAE